MTDMSEGSHNKQAKMAVLPLTGQQYYHWSQDNGVGIGVLDRWVKEKLLIL